MTKITTAKWLYSLYLAGPILAALCLVAKLLRFHLEVYITLWIFSIILVTPYIIYKLRKHENFTAKELWPWSMLAAICVIYLILNNK